MSSGAEIFQRAHREFLSSLSENEQSQFSRCASAKELLLEAGKLGEAIKDERRWAPILQRIKLCSDRLQPYFKICEVVLQTHPEWTALAWGSFLLVLKVRLSQNPIRFVWTSF
jgi:hypothetical protein